MSSRAWSTVFPLVRTYRAPSPSTRDSSATDRTRSFLCVIAVAAPSDHPAGRHRRAYRLRFGRLGPVRRPGVVDRVAELAFDVDHTVDRADGRQQHGQHALALELAGQPDH